MSIPVEDRALLDLAVGITLTNPVWAEHMTADFAMNHLAVAISAHRIRFIHFKNRGMLFYTWCRAEGPSGISLLSGARPRREDWQSTKGFLMVADICFTPEVSPSSAVRAMMRDISGTKIAKSGEKVYFVRTTPGRPERIGWITARG